MFTQSDELPQHALNTLAICRKPLVIARGHWPAPSSSLFAPAAEKGRDAGRSSATDLPSYGMGIKEAPMETGLSSPSMNGPTLKPNGKKSVGIARCAGRHINNKYVRAAKHQGGAGDRQR
jgi:hypothetical protein